MASPTNVKLTQANYIKQWSGIFLLENHRRKKTAVENAWKVNCRAPFQQLIFESKYFGVVFAFDWYVCVWQNPLFLPLRVHAMSVFTSQGNAVKYFD